jgi:Fe-S oxidoreductase
MGLLEEPRFILRNVCNKFFEMPPNTIRERTYCCGSGAGLGSDEMLEVRLMGGMPRGLAVRHVQTNHDVNRLVAMCAIDRATLGSVCEYWSPGVEVMGLHELVGNALVMKGEHARTVDLRNEPLGERRET